MMMISNRLSASAARTRRARLWGLAAVILLVGIAAVWRAPLTNALLNVLSPLLHARYIGAEAPAAASVADRDALFKENQELKARLGRSVSYERVLAGVLLRPPATPYDTFLLDAGSTEGVSVGDVVSAGGTTVIGTITEVYAHTSRATLFSAPGNSYDATLRLHSGSIAIAVEGQGGGALQALVPAGTAVAVGDFATLPGVKGGYVAEVAALERGESDSFTTVYFKVPVDLFMLHFVEVWKTHE